MSQPAKPNKTPVVPAVLAIMVIVVIGTAVTISSLRNSGGNLERLAAIKKQFDEKLYSFAAPGVVKLTAFDRSQSVDGFIYVTGDPPTLILFPRWRGEGSSLVATGWSAQELVAGASVDAVVPETPPGGASTESAVPATQVRPLRVVKSLGNGWYLFERRQS